MMLFNKRIDEDSRLSWPVRALPWLLGGLLCLAAFSVPLQAGGTQDVADVRIVAERAPAGGLAVLVIELTEPKPITTGELCLRFSMGPVLQEVNNVALLSTSPISGSAQVDGGQVDITFNSPDGSFGNEGDLPLMVLAIPVSELASTGESASIVIDLSQTTLRDPDGQPYVLEVDENDFRVGGVSVTSMEPASGIINADEFITFRGVGFQPDMEIDINEADHGDAEFISPTEARVRVQNTFELFPTTRVRVRVRNDVGDEPEDEFYPAAFLPGLSGNSPPIAVDDMAQTAPGVPVEIEVLSNDEDPDGDPIELVQVDAPSSGFAEIVDDRVRYTPAAGFSGEDSFGYHIADDRGAQASALVRVQVEGAAPQPVLSINSTLLRLANGQSADVEVDVSQGTPGQTVTLRAQDSSLAKISSPQTLISPSQRLTFRVRGRQPGEGLLVAELGQVTDSIPLGVVRGSALTIPVIRNNSVSRLGLALVNGGPQEAEVLLRAYPSGAFTSLGAPAPRPVFLQNAFTLQAGQQSSRFIDEIDPALQDFSGWLEITSPQEGLHATFLNLPAGRIIYAGGSGSIEATTTAFVTGSSFSGESPPEVSIIQRDLDPVGVEVDWFGGDGTLLGSLNLTLSGEEALHASFSDLFPDVRGFAPDDYLRVQARQPVVIYQQSLAPNYIFGQAAAQPAGAPAGDSPAAAQTLPGRGTLCLTHFVSGAGFFSEISLVNGSSTADQAHLTLIGNSPQDPLSGQTASVDLAGHQQVLLRVEEIFGLDAQSLTSGSLIIDVPSGSAAAAVMGRLDDPSFRTALPLPPNALGEAVFAQVANGMVGSTHMFTGLAVLNLSGISQPGGGSDGEVLIEVFTAQGQLAGRTLRPLPGDSRSAMLLQEWVEDLPDQQGGHIRISADVPMAVLELFGDFNQTFLSTVSASPGSFETKGR